MNRELKKKVNIVIYCNCLLCQWLLFWSKINHCHISIIINNANFILLAAVCEKYCKNANFMGIINYGRFITSYFGLKLTVVVLALS